MTKYIVLIGKTAKRVRENVDCDWLFWTPNWVDFSTISPRNLTVEQIRFVFQKIWLASKIDLFDKMPKGSKRSKGTEAPAKEPKGSEASAEESCFNRPMKLSPNLADIVGMNEASPKECIRKLWAYQKSNNLQDPKDRTYFTPDKKMAKVFGKDRIKVFDMMKYIDNHLTKIDSKPVKMENEDGLEQTNITKALDKLEAKVNQVKKEEFFIPSTVLAGPRSKKSKKN